MEPDQTNLEGARRLLSPSIPWVSGAVMVACVGVFLFERLFGRSEVAGILYGPAVINGQWYRVFSHVFEHGNLLHLFMNMSVVFTLGFSVERVVGSWRFFLISLITALGSATFVLLFAFTQPTVGASGMILGWAGALLPIASQQGRRSLGTWLVQIAIISVLPGISWQGHLGGFLLGLPCGILLRRRGALFAPLAPALLLLAAGATWFAAHHPIS